MLFEAAAAAQESCPAALSTAMRRPRRGARRLFGPLYERVLACPGIGDRERANATRNVLISGAKTVGNVGLIFGSGRAAIIVGQRRLEPTASGYRPAIHLPFGRAAARGDSGGRHRWWRGAIWVGSHCRCTPMIAACQ